MRWRRDFQPLVLVSLLCLSASHPASAALALCSQPMAPTTWLHKPTKPFCAASRTCEEWEVDSYRNEVERYYSSLKSYLAEVDAFYEEAYSYAKCMAALD